jgi:hypothetical protein
MRDREADLKALAEELAKPEVNGNISAAATNLGMNYQRAYKLVQVNPFLKAMHKSKDPETIIPCDPDLPGRPPIMTPEEMKEAMALRDEVEALALGKFDQLALTEVERDVMQSMENFGRMPLDKLVALTHGGVAKTFLGLMAMQEKFQREFLNDNIADEYDKEGNQRPIDAVQRDWMQAFIHLSSEIRQVKGQVDKSNLLMIKAEQLKKDKGKKSGKPGFSPMISAQAGSTVIVNESEQS